MNMNEKARLALRRMLIELDWADEKIGSARRIVRQDTMRYAEAILVQLEQYAGKGQE